MSSRKTQISLLLIALASCFMMAANAQYSCVVCLYSQNTNNGNDHNQGACFGVAQSSLQESDFDVSTPFVGDDNGVTVNAFRYVGFTECDRCTLTAYSNAGLTGKSAVISNTVGYGSVGFCAKSFYFYCAPDPNATMQEEQEE